MIPIAAEGHGVALEVSVFEGGRQGEGLECRSRLPLALSGQVVRPLSGFGVGAENCAAYLVGPRAFMSSCSVRHDLTVLVRHVAD